ncbi:tetratricopeptide repeat protein [Chondrinema litorale]|uniref:tetratricopeptide repeat protein n=1 Tax=Chondrinema litorale TaxID=2994555 RepID=UPI002542EFC5|nr:tetratricopeptide repeat protein [Chondrinema litorale]UZR94084.1 tetratricopeptide repeat protein [Chondrinema litorale]
MLRSATLFTFISFISFSGFVNAQDLEIRDKAEISYKAELLVNEFQNLLNVISNEDMTLTETEEIIKNSYDVNGNRIFLDAEITVEDDINPNNVGPENVVDASVEKYLKDFDLFYTKSPDFTVTFSNVKVSKIYNKDFFLARVYFEREFTSKHNTVEIPYNKVERVADIKAIKNGSQWETYIISVTFYNPDNPLEFEEIPEDTGVSTTTTNISSLAYDNTEVQKEAKRLQEEYLKEKEATYNDAIKRGDIAFEKEDYQAAIDAYNEARDIDPFKIYASKRVNEINRIITSGKFNREELYQEAIFNGDNSLKARAYERAKNFYLLALKQKPNETWLNEKIRSLDNTIRSKANLDSKYFAGDYKEAIKDYSKVIRKEKENPEYYLGRGKCYLAIDDRKKALKDFDEAIALDINYIDALATRAEYYVSEAQRENDDSYYYKAIEDYTVILGIEGADPKYNNERAMVKLKLKNPDGAISDLTEALVKNKEGAELLASRGSVYMSKNDYTNAMKDFNKAIELDPEYSVAYYQRGVLNVKMDRIEKASEDFSKARRAGLEDQYLNSIKEITLDFYNLGKNAFTSQNYEQAKLYFDKALVIDPYFSEGWYEMGQLYALEYNREEAIKMYSNAIQNDIKYGEAYFERGTMKLLIEDFKGAVFDFEKTNEILPGKVEALLGMGDAYMGLGEYSNAVLAYNRAYKQNSSDPEIMNRLGYALYKNDSYKEAIKLFDEAIKENKIFAEAYFKRGMAYAATQDFKSAIKDFDEAVSLGYEAKMANFEIGNAYQLQGDHKKAVNYYTDAISLDPNFAEAYVERAESNRANEDFNDAIRDLLDAARIEPTVTDAEYYVTMGMLHLDLGLNQDADGYFSQALQLDNDNPDAFYGKACVYSQNMNISEALVWFKKAFESRKITGDQIKDDQKSYLRNIKSEKEFKNLVKIYIKN